MTQTPNDNPRKFWPKQSINKQKSPWTMGICTRNNASKSSTLVQSLHTPSVNIPIELTFEWLHEICWLTCLFWLTIKRLVRLLFYFYCIKESTVLSQEKKGFKYWTRSLTELWAANVNKSSSFGATEDSSDLPRNTNESGMASMPSSPKSGPAWSTV